MRTTPRTFLPGLRTRITLIVSVMLFVGSVSFPAAQKNPSPDAPVVRKVEPPNWWVGLTPEVMILLSGKNLNATRASCNLQEVIVNRTQSSADGDYLFVWLKFNPKLKSGTAVCRLTTPRGETTFELPIAARKAILGRNQGLAPDDVLYLIMPDRFANGDPTNDEPKEFPGSHDRANPRAWHGGDLRGVREHLDYLNDLGITTICLTPVVKNGATADYHGYGAVDLYAVDPHLGTLRDYQELVDTAHKKHMKVFFDLVPNHVGPANPWVAKPPLPDWFHGTAQQHIDSFSPIKGSFYGHSGDKKDIANDPFEALEDPHTPPAFRKNLTDGWFLGILPDMNTENPIVAEYLLQNAIWWAESSGLDGYRLDTFPYVSRKFWSDWHEGLRKIYQRLSTIGEAFHPDPTVTSFFVGGRKGWDGIDTGLTTLFDFPMFFAVRNVLLKDAPAGAIPNILRQDSLYPYPEYLVPFFANHDVPRFASIQGATPEKLKLAFGLTLTLRGIPEIYYGDEIAMPGGGDPDNRRDFPGGWPGDAANAFTREGRTPAQQEVFDYVRALLHLRQEHDALRDGKLGHLYADDSTYIFLRESEEETLIVAFHKGAADFDSNLSVKDTPAQGPVSFETLFGSGKAESAGQQLHLRLPAQSLTIFALH
jgi:neopullulanase